MCKEKLTRNIWVRVSFFPLGRVAFLGDLWEGFAGISVTSWRKAQSGGGEAGGHPFDRDVKTTAPLTGPSRKRAAGSGALVI